MPAVPEKKPVSTSLQTWLTQGEQLYAAALNDFRAIEAQLDELEQKLTAKQAEVNQIAQVIGKPTVEGSRRLSATLSPPPLPAVDEPPYERMPVPTAGMVGMPTSTSSSNATIARALTGKFGGR